ncbi:hypothetical protein [Kitasatospora sp. NPDC004272]
MSPKKNRSTASQSAREAQAAGATEPYNVLRRAASTSANDADGELIARAMARDFAPQPAVPLWEPVALRPWTPTTLVRINDDWDRDQASRADGSRYATYVQQHAEDFQPWDDEPNPVEFAVAAWRVATVPVMAPGYVSVRPDLRRITLHRDDWDGALVVRAAVPLRHHHLTARLPYLDDWETDRDPFSGYDYRGLLEPHPERAWRSAVLTTAEVHHRAKGWPLHSPAVVEGPGLAAEAHAALLVLVERINAEVGPLVQQLLSGAR